MKYSYIKFFEDKLKELSKESYVLDVGGGTPFQKGMAKYKDWFAGKRFVTIDKESAYHPDIIGDVHELPLNDEEVAAILCNAVLEHLYDPKRAVEEMYRVLMKGGKLLAYTHFIYPYHGRTGVYEDYFRFTESGLRYLFRQFSQVEVRKQGGFFTALMYFLPLISRIRVVAEPVAHILDWIFRTERRSTTAGFYVYAIK